MLSSHCLPWSLQKEQNFLRYHLLRSETEKQSICHTSVLGAAKDLSDQRSVDGAVVHRQYVYLLLSPARSVRRHSEEEE